MVVRAGNPKAIRDWADLGRDDVAIVTPNPKTSGNGKWSVLAIWLSLKSQGRTDDQIERFLVDLFRRVPVLDAGARGATMTFADKRIGDVQLTWENEAISELAEYPDRFEIVRPATSIRAEPHVAVVDGNVRKNRSGERAAAYLKFLYTDEGQAIGMRHGYRPTQIPVPADRFPPMTLLDAQTLGSWDEIQSRFFADGALFDRILEAGRQR
jgi:sulfate transport system substrate-binding protein